MNLIPIILLVGLAALAWFWLKKPNLKRTAARAWLASRGKPAAKPKPTKTV